MEFIANQLMNKDIVQHLFTLLDTNVILDYRLVCKLWSHVGLLFIHKLSKLPPNDEGLEPFILLTSLDLFCNKTITDEGLKHTPLLKSLNLEDNRDVSKLNYRVGYNFS